MESVAERLQLHSWDPRELNRRIGIVSLWHRYWRAVAELLLMLSLLLLVQLYLLLFPLLAVRLNDLQFEAAAGVPERVQALEVRGELQEAALWEVTERWAGEGTWESGN